MFPAKLTIALCAAAISVAACSSSSSGRGGADAGAAATPGPAGVITTGATPPAGGSDFCATVTHEGQVLQTIGGGDPSKVDPAVFQRELNAVIGAAPAEIKSDVQVLGAVELQIVEGHADAEGKLQDPATLSHIRHFVSWMQQNCPGVVDAPTLSAGGVTATSSAAGTSGACHPDVTPQICVTVQITGTKPVAGTAQTTAPAPPEADPSWTCAQLAANTAGDDRDLGDTLTSLGGHAVQWDAPIGDKPGTGTYPLSRTGSYVDVDGVGFDAEHGTANLTLRPDYSATFTFENLSSDAGAISGSISWTCLDPQ